ncbi:MAG: PKD domain-containing protein [Nitrospirota bacterium]
MKLSPVLLGALLMLAGCSGGSGGSSDGGGGGTNGTLIGSSGGTVTSGNGTASLTIPAGALASNQAITVEPVANPPAGAIAAFELGPDGLQFSQPVTVTITYDEASLPAGVSEADLFLRTFENGVWIATGAVENSTVDATQNTVSAQTTHFSVFGVVPLLVLNAPTVSLSSTPASGPAPLEVTLTATAADPDGGMIVSYEWDFENDGVVDQTTTTGNVTHAYPAGAATAKVTVSDDEGQLAEATASVSVSTTTPTVSLVADPPSGFVPLLVLFTATASDPDGGTLVKYEWDLDGDGTFEVDTGTSHTAARTYSTPGVLTGPTAARVRVTDDEGATAEATVTVTVTLASAPERALSAGGFHTCTGGGTVECWGSNVSGRLGNGTTTDSSTRVTVTGITNATDVSAGGLHTCAVLAGGTVRCWGENERGQLGDGTQTESHTPVDVTGITTATAIALGLQHTCAVLSDGTVNCWGSNAIGQLGDGTTTDSSTPVSVTGINTAIAVSAGFFHTCALLSVGTVNCWGANFNGQLGNGTTTESSTPVEVDGITTATAISGSVGDHTCAALSSGAVNCWGRNAEGQLGDGTTTDSSTPVPVTGITTAMGISAGFRHSCAVLLNGTAKCWGDNEHGQLGDGTNTESHTPVPVTGITNATAISAGGEHTCALLADHTVDCWGIPIILTATPSWGGVPLSVTFTADAMVSDPDEGTIVSYEWDLDGNGAFEQNTGTTKTAPHTYTTAGDYVAKVRVTDNQGRTAQATTSLSPGRLLSLSGDITMTHQGSPSGDPRIRYDRHLTASLTVEVDEYWRVTVVDAVGTFQFLVEVVDSAGCTSSYSVNGQLDGTGYGYQIHQGLRGGLQLGYTGVYAERITAPLFDDEGNVTGCATVSESQVPQTGFTDEHLFDFVLSEDGVTLVALDFNVTTGDPPIVGTGRLE